MADDTDMRERLERVEAKVDGLQTSVEGLQTTVGVLQTTVGSLATTVGSLQTTVGNLQTTVGSLATTVDVLTGAVARQAVHFDSRMEDLGRRFQVQTEAQRELLVTFADNFGGVLDGIQREFRDFRAEFRARGEATDTVLANHAQRIVVLERVTGVSPE